MPLLLAAIAGLALYTAFPPLGWGWVAVPAITLLQVAALRTRRPAMAWGTGLVFTVAFVAPLMRWLAVVEPEAWVGFVLAHAPFFAVYTRLVHAARDWPRWQRLAMVAGGWVGALFLLRWLPVLGIEWVDPGYTVVGWEAARSAAAIWGASGWGVLLALAATGLSVGIVTRDRAVAIGGLAMLAIGFSVGLVVDERPTGGPYAVAIVQGHPPCELLPCTASREAITANHLRLTESLDPGPELVVWPESSTGFSTDPGQSPAVAEAIVREAGRLDAYFLVGADRPAGAVNFANANMLFDTEGRLVGEYLKQHGVPFGEFVPLRGLIGGIPPFTRVPRDMIPGRGPVILDAGDVELGTVISFEGAFGRYAREHAALGAEVLVVNTNNSSYGRGAASDQFIAMTSMRSAELGLDVVHAAVSGKSTIITDGGVPGPRTDNFEEAIVKGTVTLRDAPPTVYARFGDWLVALVLVVAGAIVVRHLVVVSAPSAPEPDAVDA